jgi:MFS family permease
VALPSGAALLPAERRAVASLAAIYAVRLLGLFLLLPVLALHAGAMPGGTPLLAGLAVGAYGLAQAVMQIPFGVWSDRIGRKPLIVVGLLLHVAGSVLGAVAANAAALVAARVVQGLGAVSGPVTAFLADLVRPESRTRAMFVGLVALGLLIFALPAERQAAERVARGGWREAATRELAPHYAGIFMLHLTLTAAFIAVPHVLRDVHGIGAARHWLVYLAVFLASVVLTVPLVLWSERQRRPGRPMRVGGAALAVALAALAFGQAHFDALIAALVLYFGAFNFLEARLPAALTEAAGEASRGAALGVFATCQFAGAFAGGLLGGALLGSRWQLTGIFACAALAALAWLPWVPKTESPQTS